jgi:hemoglobin
VPDASGTGFHVLFHLLLVLMGSACAFLVFSKASRPPTSALAASGAGLGVGRGPWARPPAQEPGTPSPLPLLSQDSTQTATMGSFLYSASMGTEASTSAPFTPAAADARGGVDKPARTEDAIEPPLRLHPYAARTTTAYAWCPSRAAAGWLVHATLYLNAALVGLVGPALYLPVCAFLLSVFRCVDRAEAREALLLPGQACFAGLHLYYCVASAPLLLLVLAGSMAFSLKSIASSEEPSARGFGYAPGRQRYIVLSRALFFLTTVPVVFLRQEGDGDAAQADGGVSVQARVGLTLLSALHLHQAMAAVAWAPMSNRMLNRWVSGSFVAVAAASLVAMVLSHIGAPAAVSVYGMIAWALVLPLAFVAGYQMALWHQFHSLRAYVQSRLKPVLADAASAAVAKAALSHRFSGRGGGGSQILQRQRESRNSRRANSSGSPLASTASSFALSVRTRSQATTQRTQMTETFGSCRDLGTAGGLGTGRTRSTPRVAVAATMSSSFGPAMGAWLPAKVSFLATPFASGRVHPDVPPLAPLPSLSQSDAEVLSGRMSSSEGVSANRFDSGSSSIAHPTTQSPAQSASESAPSGADGPGAGLRAPWGLTLKLDPSVHSVSRLRSHASTGSEHSVTLGTDPNAAVGAATSPHTVKGLSRFTSQRVDTVCEGDDHAEVFEDEHVLDVGSLPPADPSQPHMFVTKVTAASSLEAFEPGFSPPFPSMASGAEEDRGNASPAPHVRTYTGVDDLLSPRGRVGCSQLRYSAQLVLSGAWQLLLTMLRIITLLPPSNMYFVRSKSIVTKGKTEGGLASKDSTGSMSYARMSSRKAFRDRLIRKRLLTSPSFVSRASSAAGDIGDEEEEANDSRHWNERPSAPANGSGSSASGLAGQIVDFRECLLGLNKSMWKQMQRFLSNAKDITAILLADNNLSPHNFAFITAPLLTGKQNQLHTLDLGDNPGMFGHELVLSRVRRRRNGRAKASPSPTSSPRRAPEDNDLFPVSRDSGSFDSFASSPRTPVLELTANSSPGIDSDSAVVVGIDVDDGFLLDPDTLATFVSGTSSERVSSEVLADILKLSPTLRTLTLDRCILRQTDVDTIIMALANAMSIMEDDLRFMVAQASQIRGANPAPIRCKADSVDCDGTSTVGSTGVAHGKFSGTSSPQPQQSIFLPGIQNLNLSGCNLRTGCMVPLAALLAHPKCTIRRINLSNNAFGPHAAFLFAGAMLTNKSVREVDFCNNQLGYLGTRRILDSIPLDIRKPVCLLIHSNRVELSTLSNVRTRLLADLVKQTNGTTEQIEENDPRSLYELVGGGAVITEVVDAFFTYLIADAAVGPIFFHHVATGATRANMTSFLCQTFGGPEKYDGKDLMATHRHLPITHSLFDKVVGHLGKAILNTVKDKPDIALRLLRKVENFRDKLVNRTENGTLIWRPGRDKKQMSTQHGVTATTMDDAHPLEMFGDTLHGEVLDELEAVEEEPANGSNMDHAAA